MLIYNYDPITMEYTFSEEAGRNPLNADEPIIPAHATTMEPLEAQMGYAITWAGNKWRYKEDHRGEIWYNAQTKQVETVDFLGELPSYFYPPDSTIANKPDGDYWIYDGDTQTWIGNAQLYKLYVLNSFNVYWSQKQNTPFEFKGYRYLPSWRELYTSIWVALKDGLKQEYRIQDYDSKFNTVDVVSMKEIITKISDIYDEMYIDKHNLEAYFKIENDFNNLQNMFNTWLKKEYN